MGLFNKKKNVVQQPKQENMNEAAYATSNAVNMYNFVQGLRTIDSNYVNNDALIEKETETIIEEQKPIAKYEVKTMTLDTRTALNHIANELGICIAENESKEILEEMAATTNELIMSFSKLPDWEKLKSWDKFVQDWQAIMGDAINDRN